VRLAKFRFKPEGQPRWLDWCEELTRRSGEVLETLRNEGVVAEACFLSASDNAVYDFIAAEDFDRAERAVQRSPYAIDRQHIEVKAAALDAVEQLPCLFHFENR